jgi:secreted PhoX family phosphatase
MYKFVSSGKYDPGNRNAALSLLDSGTLYAAKFNDDGSGRWIPLVQGSDGLTEANGFATQADVLVNTRGAGDQAGATRMDRPEDIETNPVNGKVYAAMTNNTNRTAAQVDRANPRAGNRYGHIIEISEAGNDPGAISFTWNIFILCGVPGSGDGSSFAGYDPAGVSAISSPDNIAFDSAGNLWIATDGQPGTLSSNDGIFVCPVEGPDRGHLRMLLTGPFGCETASLEFTPDDTTLFVSIQHPGERGTGPNSANASIATPTSLWPDGVTPPRPSVIAVVRTAPANPVIGT